MLTLMPTTAGRCSAKHPAWLRWQRGLHYWFVYLRPLKFLCLSRRTLFEIQDSADGMTKDLFLRLFREYSRWDYEYFYRNFIERLPHRFLDGALTANPSVQTCRGFEELQLLFSSASADHRKNPELYPYLNCLLIPGFAPLQATVDAIRVHVGL